MSPEITIAIHIADALLVRAALIATTVLLYLILRHICRIATNTTETTKNMPDLVTQLTAIKSSLSTVGPGITALDAKIQQLATQIANNPANSITPEAQALLNDITGTSGGLSSAIANDPNLASTATPEAPATTPTGTDPAATTPTDGTSTPAA